MYIHIYIICLYVLHITPSVLGIVLYCDIKKNKNKKGIIHLAWKGSWSNRKKDSIKKKDKLSTYSILSKFLLSKHLFFVCFLSKYYVSVWRVWIRKFSLKCIVAQYSVSKTNFHFLKKITTSHVLVIATFY